MAQRRRRNGYMSDGTAAYDLRLRREAVETEQPQLPEEQPQRPKKVRVKAKTVISPFAVLGMMTAGFFVILVIFSYVQLYEASSEVGRLKDELAAVEQNNQILRSQYEGKIDLAAIEDRAIHELGMVQPTASQNVYLNLSGIDRAEIVETEKTGFFETLAEACSSGIRDLAAYLSRKPER